MGFNSAAHGDFRRYEAEEKAWRALKAAEAAEAAKQRAEQEKPADSRLTALVRGAVSGMESFRNPGNITSKLAMGAMDGVFGYMGHTNTKGITFSGSLGFGASIGAEVSLVETRRPDGGKQYGVLWSKTGGTAGWNFGASFNAGMLRSNADDIDQLKGAGWDKSLSGHAGLGIWGNHQNAIHTENSKGEPVTTFSGGIGTGAGLEAATGFSFAEELWRAEDKKREKE